MFLLSAQGPVREYLLRGARSQGHHPPAPHGPALGALQEPHPGRVPPGRGWGLVYRGCPERGKGLMMNYINQTKCFFNMRKYI